MRVMSFSTGQTGSGRDTHMGSAGWRVACSIAVLLAALCSCAPAVHRRSGRAQGLSPADTYDEAYRAGMEAALRAYQEQYLDNDFPYTNWSPPLVQRVWMPPQIVGGVFIPGHMDDVIIKPGAWKREFAAPLSSHQPLSHTRPYTHDHTVGWADRPSLAPAPDTTAQEPVRERQGPDRWPAPPGTAGARAWAGLPPPDAAWLTK